MSDPGLEIATEAAKAAATELVRPAATVIDNVIGTLIGDRLAEYRERQKRVRARRHADLETKL